MTTKTRPEQKKVDQMTLEDAVEIAQTIERYEAAISQLKDKLKAYVELNGPVKANGKVWDFFYSTSWEFAPDRLKAMAGMMVIDGFNPFELFTLSSSAIKKLGWSEEILLQYGKKVQKSKSFRSVKAENYSK
jgi:hypothetical protein